MGYFSPLNIAILLIDLAMAWHVIRSGRSPMWIMGMGLASFINVLALFALWLAYVVMAVVPDFLNSHSMRSFTGSVVKAADPGRGYREKKKQVELVGSVDAKRALAPGGDAASDRRTVAREAGAGRGKCQARFLRRGYRIV